MAESHSDEFFSNILAPPIDFVRDMSHNLFVTDQFSKYRDAAADAVRELKTLGEQNTAIEYQMGKLRRLLMANVNMLPEDEQVEILLELESVTPPSGLSDAVMRVLDTEISMNAAAVRERLTKSGFDLTEQVNPLASIHTTLRRLADAEKIKAQVTDGKTTYRRFTLREEVIAQQKIMALSGMAGAPIVSPPPRFSTESLGLAPEIKHPPTLTPLRPEKKK